MKYRCLVIAYEMELYGKDLVWEFAGYIVDKLFEEAKAKNIDTLLLFWQRYSYYNKLYSSLEDGCI